MIRTATVEDIPAIRDLAGKAFPATYKDILSPEQIEYMMDWMYSERPLRSQMTEQGHVFFISDGEGYVSFRHEKTLEDGTELFHLEKLYVVPECQGRGLGRALFDTVVSAARAVSSGPARIELNVNRYNKAVSFYEHIGMRRDREGDFPIGGGYYMNDYIYNFRILREPLA